MSQKRHYLVTVCDHCLRASCWHGEFFCEKARSAGTRQLSDGHLRSLGLEHPSNYSVEKLTKVCGGVTFCDPPGTRKPPVDLREFVSKL